MKLFFHYCPYGFSNCYILGTDYAAPGPETYTPDKAAPRDQTPREALIIDPGVMDVQILKFIEGNEYTLRGVLLSHDHAGHSHGLGTIKKIYDVEIFAVSHTVGEFKTTRVKDGDHLTIGPFAVDVLSVPGHSSDSAVYRIERLLFTGDALSAGLVGSTASSYGATVQMNALQHKILSLPGDYLVLPGHGPPSNLEAERRFNAGIEAYNKKRAQKPQRFYRSL
ncbi:MAG: MBL fold metallo-hydrolase [Spirochaetaceae bacterium]|nr:MBL fold metallo-hydrolase [Spirochaetaceae bacterium]